MRRILITVAAGGALVLFLSAAGAPASAHTKEGKRTIVTAFGEAGCRGKVITKAKKEECMACVKQGAAYHYHPYEPEGSRCHKASEGAGAGGGEGGGGEGGGGGGAAADGDKKVTAHGEAGCRMKVAAAAKRLECMKCVKQGAAYHYHPHVPPDARCHKASECPHK